MFAFVIRIIEHICIEREELLDEGIEVIGNIYENPELIK